MSVERVEDCLESQRSKSSIDVEQMSEFIFGKDLVGKLKSAFLKNSPIESDFNILNKGRVQILKRAYQLLPTVVNSYDIENDGQFLDILYNIIQQMPGSIHYSMFVKCIDIMGSEEQKRQYLQRGRNYEVIGCYAQTEIGHGSDIQSLETTATLIEESGEIELHTPRISSAKYWPGDLGVMANHALVFAQLIMKGKQFGVHPFIVRIRDENWNCLPGIEAGDIGPKMAFYAKENGYLLLNRVRIPRTNILAKFLHITPNGELQRTGDPKVSYATMMQIRQYISVAYPKILGQASAIAIRYSMFRKQFKGKSGQENRVIDYQAQQEKLVPRVAEYFAMAVGGNVIKKLCLENYERVTRNSDFSLMGETHVCLCIGKALFSEIVYDGMEICRKACGGHGYSHYSGIPNMIGEYAPNLTHEGENTVLYLQIARYVLKNYRAHMTQSQPLNQNAKYIGSIDYFMSLEHGEHLFEAQNWTCEDIRKLLAQNVCCLISSTTSKLMSKPDELSDMEFMSYFAGSNLQSLAKAHSFYFTYSHFAEAILHERNERNKVVLEQLCKLFGIYWFEKFASPVLEQGILKIEHLQSLRQHMEQLMSQLRPNLISLVDSFMIPENRFRSHLATGNPYENYLSMARKNQINLSQSKSALLVKDKISEVLLKHGHPRL